MDPMLSARCNEELCFGNEKLELNGYTDADWISDKDLRKLTSDFVTTFAWRFVSWESHLQKCVALSTMEAEYIVSTEAEYIVSTEACKEMLWMNNFFLELVVKQTSTTYYATTKVIFT